MRPREDDLMLADIIRSACTCLLGSYDLAPNEPITDIEMLDSENRKSYDFITGDG